MKLIACALLAGLASALSVQECRAEFYIFGNVGYSKNFYGNNPNLQDFVGGELANESSRVPLALDFGWMFKLIPHFTLGLAWDASYDYFYQNNSSTNAGAVEQNSLVFTSRQYFAQDLGKGLYTRFDAGLGWLSTSGNISSTSSTSPGAQGLYLLAGLGVGALQIPPLGTICFEVDASRLFLSGGAVYTIQPKIGITFSSGGKSK